MTTRVLRALVRKEAIEIVRDPITLAVAIVLPLLMLFIFGYGISMDVEDVPLAVRDRDGTQESRRLTEAFVRSGYFHLQSLVRSDAQARAVLDTGKATIVLDIPADFTRDLQAGREASVQLLLDGSFSATALIVSNYAAAVINRFSEQAAQRRLAELGLSLPPPVQLETRVWFNPSMRTVNYIVPGLFAVLLMAFPPMLTALAIVRERERGTIEQIYVSPVTPALFVVGKVLPYALIAFAEMLLVLGAGTAWFGIPLRGSLALLLGASLLYVFVTVALGVAVSAMVRTQVAAVFLSLVGTLMPSFLFSGFLFPIGTMPFVLQLYTYAFPTRYFNDISRDLFLKGVGLEYLWGNLALLAVYAAVLLVVASLSLRKKVAR
jgi:ABC-2 type transport system permease protein